MNTMEQGHTELLHEYRLALELWCETRAFYAADSPEVALAISNLEALERELAALIHPAIAA